MAIVCDVCGAPAKRHVVKIEQERGCVQDWQRDLCQRHHKQLEAAIEAVFAGVRS